jgi:HAD superfamily hydrolase (TIGR01450 family)
MARLSPLLESYDQVILDLDGCVWLGAEPVEGSPEAVAALREAGKRVAFATNNSWHPGEDHVASLWRMGIKASLGDVVTVGGAMQHLLAETRSGRTAYVIGTAALRRHVAEAGLKLMNDTDLASRAEVVVTGGTDQLHYDDLRTAALAVYHGADFLATSRDPALPTPEGPWPGTGAILAAVETAAGRRAQIVGKPEPQLFFTALDRLGEGRTLVVGDRLDSDVAAAAAAGLDAALVHSGVGAGEISGEAGDDVRPVPVAEAANLSELVLGP